MNKILQRNSIIILNTLESIKFGGSDVLFRRPCCNYFVGNNLKYSYNPTIVSEFLEKRAGRILAGWAARNAATEGENTIPWALTLEYPPHNEKKANL